MYIQRVDLKWISTIKLVVMLKWFAPNQLRQWICFSFCNLYPSLATRKGSGQIIHREKKSQNVSHRAPAALPLSSWWLVCWHLFKKRQRLEKEKSVAIHAETHNRDRVALSEERMQTSIDFYTSAPTSDVVIDPSQTWGSPWEQHGWCVCVCVGQMKTSFHNIDSFHRSVLAPLVQLHTKYISD